MESLIFVTEKRDGTVKARFCANGSTQREYIARENAVSPTTITESVIFTGVIEAKQNCNVMVSDVPYVFVQTDIDLNSEHVIMKTRGILVDILVEMDPNTYIQYVTYDERGNKVLYMRMLKALCGMIIAALLYYKKFVKDIKKIGFELNPYDPCVAIRWINLKQHTTTWHIDDIKSSHEDKNVNDKFEKWLQKTYGEDGIGKVKSSRSKKHEYLAMILDFSTPGVLGLDMTEYIKKTMKEFEEQYKLGIVSQPWNDKLFKVDLSSKRLDNKRSGIFDTFTMKLMFLSKRAKQDIQPGVAFLATRAGCSTEQDWKKLIRILSFLKKTQDDIMKLDADDSQTIQWWVDAAFAVHPDYKSHTGAILSLRKGTISISTKQKVNSRSSTESELIGIDNVITKILWTKLFLEAQGFEVKLNIVYRDNTSSMKPEQNGKASSGKRTRHFNIKYFYITNLIE